VHSTPEYCNIVAEAKQKKHIREGNLHYALKQPQMRTEVLKGTALYLRNRSTDGSRGVKKGA